MYADALSSRFMSFLDAYKQILFTELSCSPSCSNISVRILMLGSKESKNVSLKDFFFSFLLPDSLE